MVLGIIVTSDRHPEHVVGLVHAARQRGHQVRLFVTHEGVRLTTHPDFIRLNETPDMEVTYCLHSARQVGLPIESVPKNFMSGSQYNNAKLIRMSDTVITL